MSSEDYFRRVIELEELYASGGISREEYNYKFNELSRHEVDRNNSTSDETELERLHSSVTAMEESSRKKIIETLESAKHTDNDNKSILQALNMENISQVTSKAVIGGANFIGSLPSKVRSVRDVVKSVIPSSCKRTGFHPLVYLEGEVPSRYQSLKYQNLDTRKIVCRCLECQEEIVCTRSDVAGRLIEDNDQRTRSRFNIAREEYLRCKLLGYQSEEMIDSINSKLNESEYTLKL